MIDMVFPDGDEKDFVDMALKLGFSSLCFVYDKIPESIHKSDKIEVFTVFLSDTKNLKQSSSDLVVVKSVGEDRYFFEKSLHDLIFDLEQGRKDKTHFRDSGLDQVNCKLARENGKLIAFNFDSILRSEGRKRSELLGRMMQNIRFCRKFNVKTVIASFASSPWEMRSPHDLKAFGISLGMHPSEAKLALRNVYDKIKHNQKKKSPNYIAEGIEIVE